MWTRHAPAGSGFFCQARELPGRLTVALPLTGTHSGQNEGRSSFFVLVTRHHPGLPENGLSTHS